MMRKNRFVFIFCVFLVTTLSCNRYSNDADLRATRDFIDAYYVMADQKKALTLSEGRAEEELQKEVALLEGIEDREHAYKARDVTFTLQRESKTDAEADYFYKLKIIQPELGNMEKTIHLVVDRKNGRIKDFRTLD
jgi:ribosomal 30S subunit maturation factor RimM